MQITFVSNYINHHQIPVSDELYKLTEGSYTFIQTEPMEAERVNMGWDIEAVKKPYVKLFYEDEDLCKRLIMESDCVIFGGTEREELIQDRLLANKFTVRYSERIYKEGRWKFVSPRGLKKKYYDHIRFNKSNVYMLCSGAYVKGDFALIHAYKGKMLKYGYFPEFIEYEDINQFRKNNDRVELLWAARFIDWKHPEMMLNLARYIKTNGLNAHITMIGSGELFDAIKESASDIEDIISFVGSKTPKEVREYMLRSDIFISTSDRKEGWGAVINEAMNSGCVTLASKEIGAAPYLIKSGINGYLYRACDSKKLNSIVGALCDDESLRKEIGLKAYKTIRRLWNPKVAALRLYEFIADSNHSMDTYKEGPLSRA